MKKIIGEKLYQLTSNDLLKGFITAVFTVMITWLGQALEKGDLPLDAATWVLELKIAVGVGIGYILKQMFTNSEGKFMKAEPKAITPADGQG